jgi:hypothetical protein
MGMCFLSDVVRREPVLFRPRQTDTSARKTLDGVRT